MTLIKPFAATYYDSTKVSLEKVITQPYDKIDPRLYQAYLGRHPWNAVRLLLGGENLIENLDGGNPYEAQAQVLTEWLGDGILKRDSNPAIYPYLQEFTAHGQRKRRAAFVALGRLAPYGEGRVFPHEETLSKPKIDRLAHLRATRTQFGLIFMLYEDAQNEVASLLSRAQQESIFDFVDEDYGVRHKVSSVRQGEIIQELSRIMETKRLLIADGHHRYETALAFRDEMRNQAGRELTEQVFDFAMMAFVNLYDEGLTIYPTHRLVRNIADDVMMNLTDLLRKDFKIERVRLPSQQAAEFIKGKMNEVNPNHHVIGLYYGGDEILFLHYLQKSAARERFSRDLSDAWRSLDVVILHALILKPILNINDEALRRESYVSYCREIDETLDAVNRGRSQIAFLLNPTRAESVRDIAFGDERMPQKSTDFYPKFMSGLLMNRMEI